MAKTYTYEDFEKALQASGLNGQFSTADLALAKRNPDAGMSLLNYKTDYMNATTDEMRALANSGAESIRKQYGEYSGGTDGSGFYLTDPSPGSFTPKTAPVYESPYGDQIAGLLGELMNREDFSYDHTTDPLYSSYAKQYTRERKRATADALGEAASATGGIPSSYAVTAATQAGDYYASQLADKIPELYEIAYNKYLQEYQMKLSDLNALQQQEAFAYGQYQDQLGQYNTDRDFDYSQFLDEIDSQRLERTEKYQREQDDYNRAWDEDERAYQREQDAYDRAWDENERAYQREQDTYDRMMDEENRAYTRAKSARSEELDLAELAAQFGDYDALRALGIDVDEESLKKTSSSGGTTLSQQRELAELAAKYGDYDLLRELGIEPDREEKRETAAAEEADMELAAQEAELYCKQMAQSGYSKKVIAEELDAFKAEGLISEKTYRRLYNLYVAGASET